MIPAQNPPQYGDELSAASADEEVLQRFIFRRTRGVLFRWTDESRKICVNVDQEEAKERQRGRKERQGGRRRDMVAPQGGLPHGWTTSAQYAAMTGAGKKSLQRTPPLSLSPPPPSMSGGIEPGTSLSLAGMNLNASSSNSSAQLSRSGSPLPPDLNFLDDGSSRPPARSTQSRHNFDHQQQQQQQHSMYQQHQHGGNPNHDASALYDTPAPDAAPLQHSRSEPSNSGDSNRGHYHPQQQQSAAYAQLQARMLAQQQQLYQKQQEELEQQQRMQREQLKKRQEMQQQEFMLQQQQLIQSYAPPPAVSGPTPILPQAPERGERGGEGRVSSQSQGSARGVETTWEKTHPTEGRNLSNPRFPLWSAGGEGGGVIGAGGGEGEGAKKQGGGISDMGELLPSSS